MSSTTITSSEFNGRNVTVGAPKAVEIEKDGKRQSVGKKAFLQYNGERFQLQSATSMRIPFGLSVFKAEGGGQDKYSINLSFNNYETDAEVKAFYGAVQAVDRTVVDAAIANSKAWFGKEKSREVLQEFFTSSVKFGKDESKKYPPTMKLNLRRNGDTFETKFYDVHGKKLTGVSADEMLAKGSLVTVLMECTDVWIAGTGKFSVRWNASQIIVHKMAESGAEFAFKGLTTPAPAPTSSNVVDEAEEEEALAPAPSSVLASVLPAEDEEDEEESERPVAPPPKVAKRKPVVIAKKA
jgi:hypothetical protein